MQALRFDQTGSLEYLKIVNESTPTAKPGEVIVKIHAAAINPSDIKNVLGKMPETKVPRIPGRDFAGVVISDSQWKNKAVFGTGGGLGFSQQGTHAEFVAIPENALVSLPSNISFAQATAMGLSYLTAWQALMVAGQLQPQETVLITGATGAVGSAAVRIAHHLGADVIGTHLSSSHILDNLSTLARWVNLDHQPLPNAVHQITNGKGANLIFDMVGGPLFEPCLMSLAQQGRQVAISSIRDPRVSFNLLDFYHKQAHLIGVDTLKLSIQECANTLKAIVPGIQQGVFISQEIDEITIEDALSAYEEINLGKAMRKKVIVFPIK